MPRTTVHLKAFQFHKLPPERHRELARQGGRKSRGFATPEHQRTAMRAGVQARASRMGDLCAAFRTVEARHGFRAAVSALWRMGKRSAYDAKYHHGLRKPKLDKE